MGHAVGDIGCLQRGAADGPGQCQRGGTGIQKNEVLLADEGGSCTRDGLLLGHGKGLLGGHGGLIGQELAVRQGGPAVHLVHLALPVQLVEVPADGRLAGVQRFAQLLHGGSTVFGNEFQDQRDPFFGQHLHPLLF